MTPIDPRTTVIEKRLAPIRNIFVVAGGKGGTGKSTVAASLGLILADAGYETGLFDLDLTGPTAHLILGAPAGFPAEPYGVRPPMHAGVHLMSVSQFIGDTDVSLRGLDQTQALLELLAIVCWPPLDILLIDMPPGLGDPTLDILRFMPRARFLLVATPSRVAIETVKKSLRFLRRQKGAVAGLVENMATSAAPSLDARLDVPTWTVPGDAEFEDALSKPDGLRTTSVYTALLNVAEGLGFPSLKGGGRVSVDSR